MSVSALLHARDCLSTVTSKLPYGFPPSAVELPPPGNLHEQKLLGSNRIGLNLLFPGQVRLIASLVWLCLASWIQGHRVAVLRLLVCKWCHESTASAFEVRCAWGGYSTAALTVSLNNKEKREEE